MHATYSSRADALAFSLGMEKSIGTQELAPGLFVDLDSNGRIVALEVLDASTWLHSDLLRNLPAPAVSR